MKEVVTVQVGSYANYIGSHYWNFQDELLGLADDQNGDPVYKIPSLDMDVLYRAGETLQGKPTYTPRLISIGSQGSLGALCSSGSLYGDTGLPDPSGIITWTGKVSRQVAEPKRKNLFLESLCEEEQEQPSLLQNSEENDDQMMVLDKDLVESLESGVQFWTDFSKVHYHPRSLYELRCSWIDIQDFDNYGIGKDSFSNGLQGEEMVDGLRFFVEECDHVQGVQFVVDYSGGFSSVAADFLETIGDDYGKTPVLLYCVKDPVSYMNAVSQKQSVSRALHDAVSFSRLSTSCKLIVPVGLPSLNRSKLSPFLSIDDAKLFHTSAVYAASIHSLSLPLRMETLGPTAESAYASGALDISELVQILAEQPRQNMVTILDVAMPAPPLDGKQIDGFFQRNLHSLTPEVAEDTDDPHAVETVIVHGALHSGGHRASISEVKNAFLGGYENGLPSPMFSHLSAAVCPLPIPLPFPSIFRSLVGEHGGLVGSTLQGSVSRGSLEINSIPMAARLRSSSAILPFLQNRLESLRRFGIQRGAPGAQLLRSWGFAKDEVEDMSEVLSKMVGALDPHTESSSDSD